MPPVTRAQTGTVTSRKPTEEAARIQAQLVELNKKAHVGTRTLTFRVGSKAVQTDEAMRALADGKKVKATVVNFVNVRGSKITGGQYYKSKVRVPGIPVTTIDSVKELRTFVNQNVLSRATRDV